MYYNEKNNKLKKAKDHQKWLELFAYFKNSDLVLKIIEDELTNDKFLFFEKFYNKENNPTKPIFNTILTQYKSVKDAHGEKNDIKFSDGTSSDTILGFKDLLSTIVDDKSLYEYVCDDLIEKTITQPSSVVGILNTHDEIAIQHFPLSQICDFEMNTNGFNWIKVAYDKDTYLLVDDEKYTILDLSNNVIDEVSHEFGKVPFCQLSNEKKDGCDFQKKSVMSDSVGDLMIYSIFKPFYDNHKMFASFPIVTYPESRTDYQEKKANKERKKNPLKFGQFIEIDWAMSNDSDVVNAVRSAVNIISGDANLLKFQEDDINKQKQKIYDDILGRGYGISNQSQAINMDQVASNFDTQERNLNNFATTVSSMYNYIANCIGREYSKSFESFYFCFGNKHFLKGLDLLYKELEQLLKTSSNFALIQDKHKEIIFTKHKDDFIERYDWISLFQPYSYLPQSYIEKKRSELDPQLVFENETFSTVLTYFELINGITIESIYKDEVSYVKYNRLKEEFNRIKIELYGDTRGEESNETESEED